MKVRRIKQAPTHGISQTFIVTVGVLTLLRNSRNDQTNRTAYTSMNLLRFRSFYCLCVFAVAFGGAIPFYAQSDSLDLEIDIYSKKDIRRVMARAFEWQAANPIAINQQNQNLWARAAFYIGIMAAYRAIGDKKYFQQALQWATSREWKLGDRPRHADDQAAGQTYLELYFLRKDRAMLAHTKTTLDHQRVLNTHHRL